MYAHDTLRHIVALMVLWGETDSDEYAISGSSRVDVRASHRADVIWGCQMGDCRYRSH